MALTTHRAKAGTRGGLAVDVDVGDGSVRVDLPAARGGSGSAPTPGSMMRASVAACLAMGYKDWGRKLGVPIEDVAIELTTEIDMAGQSAPCDAPPGWQRLRWHVEVTSGADEAAVEQVLAHAERLSPMLDCLHPRCERMRTFSVTAPKA